MTQQRIPPLSKVRVLRIFVLLILVLFFASVVSVSSGGCV